MRAPAIIVFDVNETLSDMGPIAQRFADVGAPPELAKLWFAALLRDGFGLAATGASAPFADLAAGGLRVLLTGVVEDVENAIPHVLDGFASLSLHPDVAAGIDALRSIGLRLVTLSNGSAAVAERLLTDAGIRDRFEAVLSVEQAGAWKPAPASYQYAARVCGTELGEMMLVAVHPWDTDGAARAGMQTAWVNRDDRPFPGYFTPPDHTVTTLPELARVLGPAPV